MSFYVDSVLHSGRPENAEGRTDRELLCYDRLEELGIDFMRCDHDAAETMDDCAEIDKCLGTAMCKNLFLCNRQQTEFYLLMLPGDKPFKTKVLSRLLGCSRLSFASAEYMEQLLGISPGAVSVMGIANDRENKVRLLVDREVYQCEYVGCHPCVNTSSLRIAAGDVFGKFVPQYGHSVQVVDLPWTDENENGGAL